MKDLFVNGEISSQVFREVLTGEYGDRVKAQALHWTVDRLTGGKKLPVAVAEIEREFGRDFRNLLALRLENLPQIDWDVIWNYAFAYDPEETLWMPKLVFAMAGWVEEKHPSQMVKLTEWVMFKHHNRDDFAGELLTAAKENISLLGLFDKVLNEFYNIHEDYDTGFVAELSLIWKKNPELVSQVFVLYEKIVALRMHDEVIDCIVTNLNSACYRAENTAKEEIVKLHGENAQGKKLFLDKLYKEQKMIGDFAYALLKSVRKQGRFDHKDWNEVIPQLIVKNQYFLPETRIRMMKPAMGPQRTATGFKSGFAIENLSLVKEIVEIANVSDPSFAMELFKFYRKALDLCQEHAYLIYSSIIKVLEIVVKKGGYARARFDWMPGVEYLRYPKGIQLLTDLSIETAIASGRFCPETILTALNITVFIDGLGFETDVLMRRVKRILAFEVTNGECPKFEFICRMLKVYQDYLDRFKGAESQRFVRDVVESFIAKLAESFVPKESEMFELKTLAERFEIDLMANQDAWEARKQIKKEKEAAQEELLAYFRK